MSYTDSPELRQVLLGLALNREPGWNFPGNFLDVSFDELGASDARISIEPGPHCVDADGQANLSVICVLADICMAVAMRAHAGYAMRMATVTMALQFTGAPRVGRLRAHGRFDGLHPGLARRQGLARGEIYAGDELVCTVSGSFQMLDTHAGLKPMPLRRRGAQPQPAPLAPDELVEDERAVYARARQALEPGAGAFLERFWGLQPRQTSDGEAVCSLENGLHVGNRVGHTQGGLTFALATCTAQAALGHEWRLVGISAAYVRPGTGPALRAEARTLHRGGTTALLQVDVLDHDGRVVLATVANMARAAD